MSEYRFLYGIIKKSFFCWIIVILLLVIGFQYWTIRGQDNEITTLRNEARSARADAEDMRRKMLELSADFQLVPREKHVEWIPTAHYFSDSLAGTHIGDFADFLRTLDFDDSSSIYPGHFAYYYSKKNATVFYADERILSYSLDFNYYTGGAHETILDYKGTVLRSPDGKIPSKFLVLSDIVTEEQLPELKRRLRESFIDELIRRDDMHRFNENKEFIAGAPEPTENFYYDDKGLHFYYNPYDIGSFGEGSFDLCIDWPLPDVIFPSGFAVPPK